MDEVAKAVQEVQREFVAPIREAHRELEEAQRAVDEARAAKVAPDAAVAMTHRLHDAQRAVADVHMSFARATTDARRDAVTQIVDRAREERGTTVTPSQ